jgi:hypothetical protein
VNEPEIFVLADRTLNGVVAQIGDDQWDMAMPANFVRAGSDHVPTLREIIEYHAYDHGGGREGHVRRRPPR